MIALLQIFLQLLPNFHLKLQCEFILNISSIISSAHTAVFASNCLTQLVIQESIKYSSIKLILFLFFLPFFLIFLHSLEEVFSALGIGLLLVCFVFPLYEFVLSYKHAFVEVLSVALKYKPLLHVFRI
jgi:hypothetical protein